MKKLSTRINFLAKQRTELANERTMLAYIRTALAFLGFGFVFYKLSPSEITKSVMAIFLLTAIILFLLGVYLYQARKKLI